MFPMWRFFDGSCISVFVMRHSRLSGHSKNDFSDKTWDIPEPHIRKLGLKGGDTTIRPVKLRKEYLPSYINDFCVQDPNLTFHVTSRNGNNNRYHRTNLTNSGDVGLEGGVDICPLLMWMSIILLLIYSIMYISSRTLYQIGGAYIEWNNKIRHLFVLSKV